MSCYLVFGILKISKILLINYRVKKIKISNIKKLINFFKKEQKNLSFAYASKKFINLKTIITSGDIIIKNKSKHRTLSKKTTTQRVMIR